MTRHLTVVPEYVPPEERRPVKTPNDLPPSWDGYVVSWGTWRLADVGSLAFHAPLEALACPSCGTLDRGYWAATGYRALLPSITLSQIESAHAAGKGGKYALARFHVSRCAHCGHDQVYDLETHELWDLEPHDYEDPGSVHPDDEGTLF